VIWDEQPDAASLAGGLLIVGAAVFIHQVGRRRAKTMVPSQGES